MTHYTDPEARLFAELADRLADKEQERHDKWEREQRCEHETHGYPHPGCADFGPPDVFYCDADATFVIWFDDVTPYGHEQDPAYPVRFCAAHAIATLSAHVTPLIYGDAIVRVTMLPAWVVRCVDGTTTRHPTEALAREYADWGHACTSTHDVHDSSVNA